MEQAVILKSEKNGLHLHLNPSLPFPTLLEEIVKKFKESENFFKNAKVAISFGGRELSEDEENQIVDVISSNTRIQILCILNHDTVTEEVIRQKTKALVEPEPEPVPVAKKASSSSIYRGSLKDGQVLESTESILIMGDVPPTATVISVGNVIVLGLLQGKVQAGAKGDDTSVIAATQFDPNRFMIGSNCYQREEKRNRFSFKSKNKTPEAMIASVSEGIIHIVPLEEFSF